MAAFDRGSAGGGAGAPWYRHRVLTREQIESALEQLDAELAIEGARAECYLVRGAVMCLALAARPSTKDVDAWFTEPQAVRRAALRVASKMALPEDWLNDAAKAFVPRGAVFERWKALPNLEVCVADERTLLAMKCAAARTQEDADDIRFLADRLGLSRQDEVLAVVLSFFPEERLPVRTRLLIEELFS